MDRQPSIIGPELRDLLKDGKADELKTFLKEQHPYDIAEFIGGLDPYEIARIVLVLGDPLGPDAFQKLDTDLQVEVAVKKVHGRGGILDYLRTAREAAPSVLPDLVIVGTADLEGLANAGHIHPLDSLLPAEGVGFFPYAVAM